MSFNEKCAWLRRRRNLENLAPLQLSDRAWLPLSWVKLAETVPRPGYVKYRIEQQKVWDFWRVHDRVRRMAR